ncbi:hypothetical protein APHAL10511_007847 [Amanita phalloides]|nr:hypothetical protein APHAL10511_007847 [Amanita phalloides]
MVKYTAAASVALLQLVTFARTSVALPIEYPEVESRAISNPDDQQLAERSGVGLGTMAVGAIGVGALAYAASKVMKKHNENQNAQAPQGGQKGDSSGSERRDLSELDARDWEDTEKRYYNDVLDRRDGARDWDEYEKRSFGEFEERDWDDYELEARGLDVDELDELD